MELAKLFHPLMLLCVLSTLCDAENSARPNGTCATKRGAKSARLSRTLDPRVIQLASASNGNPTGNQTTSLTSSNNFINFCASKHALGAKLMNGTQSNDTIVCNSIPMGMIASSQNMPSCKFQSPKNLDKLKADTPFKITLKIRNLDTGHFVNPKTSYFAAPQQLSKKTKNVIGHAHVVIQKIESLTSTEILDPGTFAFFRGIDVKTDVDKSSTVTVDKGLPAGAYRFATILSASNHQPILAGVAQRGTFDDIIYCTAE